MSTLCYNCKKTACIFYINKKEGIKCYLCRNCGRVWRDFNGFIPDIGIIKDEVDMLDVLTLDSFEAYTEAAIKQQMKDYVYKCEKCGSIAFETELGFYKCSNKNCKYMWEEFY